MLIYTGKEIVTVKRLYAEDIHNPAWTPGDPTKTAQVVWSIGGEISDGHPRNTLLSCDPLLVVGIDEQKKWCERVFAHIVGDLKSDPGALIDLPEIACYVYEGMDLESNGDSDESELITPSVTSDVSPDGSPAPVTTDGVKAAHEDDKSAVDSGLTGSDDAPATGKVRKKTAHTP